MGICFTLHVILDPRSNWRQPVIWTNLLVRGNSPSSQICNRLEKQVRQRGMLKSLFFQAEPTQTNEIISSLSILISWSPREFVGHPSIPTIHRLAILPSCHAIQSPSIDGSAPIDFPNLRTPHLLSALSATWQWRCGAFVPQALPGAGCSIHSARPGRQNDYVSFLKSSACLWEKNEEKNARCIMVYV